MNEIRKESLIKNKQLISYNVADYSKENNVKAFKKPMIKTAHNLLNTI